MTKTMSIRIDKESYDFITELSREEKGDLSKAVRELVYRGRVLLAVEKYRKREASLGKAAEIAGPSYRPHGDLASRLRTPRCRVTLYGRRVMGAALYLRDHDFPIAYSTIAAHRVALAEIAS
jgi:hypothetical protein